MPVRMLFSWAAGNGYEGIVRLLLDKDAMAGLSDKKDRTPLLWAAKNGYKAIVGLLLEKEAKAD